MDFDTVFNRVITYEQGYVNNPKDPGGETNWGISKRSHPNIDIKSLTKEKAKQIYKIEFWDVIIGDGLPSSMAFQSMDFAVNSGIQTAIRYLQRTIGVADDGHFGPISLAAIKKISESDLVMRFNAERLDYMTRLSNWDDASKGWARRVAQNLRYGALDT